MARRPVASTKSPAVQTFAGSAALGHARLRPRARDVVSQTICGPASSAATLASNSPCPSLRQLDYLRAATVRRSRPRGPGTRSIESWR